MIFPATPGRVNRRNLNADQFNITDLSSHGVLIVVSPERYLYTFVALGRFNPAILHPLWFSNNELIPEQEAVEAAIELVHPQVTSFSMSDIAVEVTGSRMAISTRAQSMSLPLRDLALGTLTILEHTPLTAIGINLQLQFKMDSRDAWHALGHRLVPKEKWTGFLDSADTKLVKVSGLRPGCSADRVEFTIGPSSEFEGGVAVAVNQHYNLEKIDDQPGRILECSRILQEDWMPFLGYVEDAASSIVNPMKESQSE
jgi:hypothetical protein